jgi:hypothetical protein
VLPAFVRCGRVNCIMLHAYLCSLDGGGGMHALICDFVFVRHTPCVTGYAMPFSLWLVSRQSERMEWTMLFQKKK